MSLDEFERAAEDVIPQMALDYYKGAAGAVWLRETTDACSDPCSDARGGICDPCGHIHACRGGRQHEGEQSCLLALQLRAEDAAGGGDGRHHH